MDELRRTFRTTILLILVVGAALAAGCSTGGPYRIDLMRAPEVYSSAGLDLSGAVFAGTGPEPRIFYATDRTPAGSGEEAPFYENRRGHVLRLGMATVELGRSGVTWEEARQISMLKNRTDKYPLQVGSVEEFGPLAASYLPLLGQPPEAGKADDPGRAFAEAINAKLARSQRREICVYVHGFKVNFENPILIATELWHFLGYEGAFVAYSWPSTPSVWAYASDAETATYAARNLRLFLDYLSAETDAEKIHVIAYSAGTRVVTGALAQLAYLGHRPRLGRVVLAASDVDPDIFVGAVADGLLDVPETLTLYASASDQALGMSSWFFGRRRLGQIKKGATLRPAVAAFLKSHPNVEVIDVTAAEAAGTSNGHAYFRDSPWVSSDVLMGLAYDLPPGARGLVANQEIPIWSFPADYVDRLGASLRRESPELFDRTEAPR